MSSSANTNLAMTTTCVHCEQSIELVLLTSQTTNEEFTFWRHIESGLYTCYLDRTVLAPDNLAEPNWGGYVHANPGEWWCGVCKTGHEDLCPDTGQVPPF